MDRFSNVELAPPIEVFAVTKAYQEDTFPDKVNLGVGAYRTDEAKPWVLPVVRTAEEHLAADKSLNKEYLNVLGLDDFTKAATSMLLGAESPALLDNRAFGVQVLSGTGGLRVGAEFLSRVLKYSVFYNSKPTWGNHRLVFFNAGFTDSREYRYWSAENKGLDIDGMLEDLRNAPENSVIILHACAHNPTGCDPTKEQWKLIADVMQERKLFPFFDSAYQGFASGDLLEDAWAVRYFVERGFELVCSQSFAKNFGLYNERIGNLTFVVSKPDVVAAVKSQVTIIIRGMYSNPPSHGARIVAYVMNNPELYKQCSEEGSCSTYETSALVPFYAVEPGNDPENAVMDCIMMECIRTMSSRIIKMRQILYDNLLKLGTPGDWKHITTQIGMFSYTGLNITQSEYMIKKHRIYMLKSGRISMCGVTPSNVEYVANAIHDTVMNCQ